MTGTLKFRLLKKPSKKIEIDFMPVATNVTENILP